MKNNLFVCIILLLFLSSPVNAYTINEPLHEIKPNLWTINITFDSIAERNNIYSKITAQKHPNVKNFDFYNVGGLTYVAWGSLKNYNIKSNRICDNCSKWYMNGSYRNAVFYNVTDIGIIMVNISNLTGNNNGTHTFLNGHSSLSNFTDVASNFPYWFDNDTSQSNGNIIMLINKTTSDPAGIFYNNSNATSNKNLSAVVPYADGWNGFWNYSYSGDGTWVVQPNGTYMQINDDLSETKKRYITNTAISGAYQVTAKLRVYSGNTQNGKLGVVLGNDGANDIESVTRDTLGTTKHDILQQVVAWGTTQGTHYQSLVAGKWLMWDANTTGTIQKGRTYQVNDIEVPWQSSGSFTTSVNKRIGIASGYGQVNEYQYWYAWTGIKINSGSWGNELSYTNLNITNWGNNYTNNQSVNLNIIPTTINFNITTNIVVDIYNWTVNGVLQGQNFNNFSYAFTANGTKYINVTAYNSTFDNYDYKNWTVNVGAGVVLINITDWWQNHTNNQDLSLSISSIKVVNFTINNTNLAVDRYAWFVGTQNQSMNNLSFYYEFNSSGTIYLNGSVYNSTGGYDWVNYTIVVSLGEHAEIISKLNQILANQADIQAKQLEQDIAIDEAKAMGFVGGVLGGALVIGVLRRRRF